MTERCSSEMYEAPRQWWREDATRQGRQPASPGGAQILRSTLWTIVRRPDFEGSGRHFDAVVHEELRPPVPLAPVRPRGLAKF